MQIAVHRKGIKFHPDASRVITRFLHINDERSRNLINSILKMTERESAFLLYQVLRDYSTRHRNISKIFINHYHKVAHLLVSLNVDPGTVDIPRQILIGSYFTSEYSIESAAFFNPSIVEHPDQSETGPGEKRVIFSFRATGEGHISSIVFRTGILGKSGDFKVEPIGRMLEEAEHIMDHHYDKKSFKHKLEEMQDMQTA